MASNGATRLSDEVSADAESSSRIDPLAQTGEQVVHDAGQLASRAADIGLQQADRGRQQAADGFQQVAQTIRRVSTDLEADQPAVANAANVAADGIERGARYLQETNAREILSSIETAARRQPLLFLGGSFVLGVIASRFIKAGSQKAADRSTTKNYGVGSLGPSQRSPQAYEATGPGTWTTPINTSGEEL